MNLKASLQIALTKLGDYSRKVKPYSFVIFILFVALLYGYVLTHIQSVSSQQPSQNAIDSYTKATKLAKIDPKIVQQLKDLQDNSVSIQTLFSDARNNPFQ